MAKSSTSFRKGQSGNPAGRPVNERALTKLLERALSARMETGGGKKKSRKQLMAEVLAAAAATGVITFETMTYVETDGVSVPVVKRREAELSAVDWVALVMRLLKHVDGPAKTEVDLDVRGEVGIVWDVPVPSPPAGRSEA